MNLNFLSKCEQPREDDIIIGLAIVPRDEGKKRWALPNRQHTKSKTRAIYVAEKINKIMMANQGMFK